MILDRHSFLPTFPTCPTFTHVHLGNHFPGAAGKLAIWSPDTPCLKLCWVDSSPHTLLLLTLNLCFCCSLCLGCSFLSHLHFQPPTRCLDGVCKTEPNTGIQEGFLGGSAPHHLAQTSRSTLFSCVSPLSGLLSETLQVGDLS